MLMKLNRDYVLTTMFGYAIRFVKDLPVDVPPLAIKAAVAIGAVEADSGNPPNVIEEPKHDGAPADPVERETQIYNAIKKVVAINDPDDFTAGNAPKAQALSRVLGYPVDRREINPLWQRYHDEKAGE
jgi:hypothetical protein